MGRRGALGPALVLLGAGAIDCGCPVRGNGAADGSGRCKAALVRVSGPTSEEAERLPVIAELEDVGAPDREDSLLGCGAEYGGQYHHRAKLGPLAARYTASDYKGQSIASNVTLTLSSPACPGTEIAFTMAGPSFVRLRRDPARDVYVVTGGILEDRAIAVRMEARQE